MSVAGAAPVAVRRPARAGPVIGRPIACTTVSTALTTVLTTVSAIALASLAAAPAASAAAATTDPASGIETPLTAVSGDATRGRAIVASRQQGLCLLCHRGPFPEERFQGTVASDLTGAGARWTAAQLRLRIVDSRRLNPDTVMPAFHRTQGLQRVGTAWQGRPVLDAQQVEDVVAFLATLKD